MARGLVQRRRGDRPFERLYRRHVEDVYRYAFAVSRNAADAEDITQTTFLNAYRAYQRGEQPRAPKNWLLAIAHNVMRQRFRQASRRPDEVGLDEEVAAAPHGDDVYSAGEITRALGELAFNQRAALVMRELEGRSYAEIAQILGLSLSAVETLIFRARRALREQLEGSLTCGDAELAVSRQLDGRLNRAEQAALRGHLRTCKECESFARSQRAQRAALRSVGAVPLPASLASFFGGGAAVGTTVAAKAAAVTAVGLLVAGGGAVTAEHFAAHRHRVDARPVAAAPARAATRPVSGASAGERPSVVRVTPASLTSSAPAAHHARPSSHGVRTSTAGATHPRTTHDARPIAPRIGHRHARAGGAGVERLHARGHSRHAAAPVRAHGARHLARGKRHLHAARTTHPRPATPTRRRTRPHAANHAAGTKHVVSRPPKPKPSAKPKPGQRVVRMPVPAPPTVQPAAAPPVAQHAPKTPKPHDATVTTTSTADKAPGPPPKKP